MAQAEEAGCPAKVVVRVFGDRNWTEEGYKTFMVEPSTKISEVRGAPNSCSGNEGLVCLTDDQKLCVRVLSCSYLGRRRSPAAIPRRRLGEPQRLCALSASEQRKRYARRLCVLVLV